MDDRIWNSILSHCLPIVRVRFDECTVARFCFA